MMNSISTFFVQHTVGVYFFYGLTFFVMGLVLALLIDRQALDYKFARALQFLAAFGILHGVHEWFEMFQQIAALTNDHTPAVPEEVVRLTILGASFVMLLAFGQTMLKPNQVVGWCKYGPVFSLAGLWGLGLLLVTIALKPSLREFMPVADVLLRYSLGLPGALLGAWALMAQQRTFREQNMPRLGHNLVWCATALFFYGLVGQIFVQQTALAPSTVINSELFLQWFGIPVQLFQGTVAVLLTIFMVRMLRVLEPENRPGLANICQAGPMTQDTVLGPERYASQEMERLNKELRLATHELSLLLDLSNLLVTPLSLYDRLHNVLEKIVSSFDFSNAGMILLVERETRVVQVQVATGFSAIDGSNQIKSRYSLAVALGEECVAKGIAMCRHLDGDVIEFVLEEALARQECRQHKSPMTMISLPLPARQRVIGSIVLTRPRNQEKNLTFEEFKLAIGIAQQLGLSIENARLHQEAKKREKMLAELLHQVVGAQEAERQRIARELHDATGQSLTAIALGLRGVETMLANDRPEVVSQIRELKLFGTNALGELRQFIADLRPPQLDDLGLVAALQWYIQAFEKRHSIQVDFVADGGSTRLLPEYETVLFRIVQESLTNIARHANASYAVVTLEVYPTQICVMIEDDGCGFDPETVFGIEASLVGWGLLGIRERALLLGGQYEVDSTLGEGTHIRVSIPLMMELKDVKDTTVAG